ncbi:acyclic terpene utilization AtuA family protein [Rhodococcus sp. IEGM 1408]|uniref:acyclic terpene utilization AtuA family protein n=1 Tax=Rhodococcus sp. IEGM 1408 TaxID=3082220 RepID=UPI0029531D96|nr:acyclic terpene utilization AtuA family protein [Rhodococcus sp. IEGM 1408]MDV8001251.1 acyclic terpene utilization AtuA family protein [Rhodococcus sp. IEGM 1408]
MTTPSSPLRIGNVSASRNDRASAAAEFLSAAALDVLALDMLSDEAMLELAEQGARGGSGYESAALVQIGECLELIGAGGVRIVTNAGALDPAGLAEALRGVAAEAGVLLSVASVDSGDVTDRAVALGLGEADVATVRHGAFGIARALAGGAHVVVTGRVSREALVTGAAAAHHGWTPAALDALAGSVAVGHVLSGGPGATGVVDSSTDVTRTTDPVTGGYPIAEIAADGSAVITRHPSAFGSVTVGTVTDQLLDGVAGSRYAAPDVVLRLDSVRLAQEGSDRVRLTGARGEPAPPVVAVVAMTRGPGRPQRVARPLAQEEAGHTVVLPGGERVAVPVPPETADIGPGELPTPWSPGSVPGGAPVTSVLGSIAGVHRGVVGRGVNIAVWTWDDSAFAWLAGELTVERFRELVPGLEGMETMLYLLPNLRAVNLVARPPRGTVLDTAVGADLASARLEIPGELLEVGP